MADIEYYILSEEEKTKLATIAHKFRHSKNKYFIYSTNNKLPGGENREIIIANFDIKENNKINIDGFEPLGIPGLNVPLYVRDTK